MKANVILLAALSCVSALTPKYQRLPTLREQAKLQDTWTAERKEAIPALLAKYGVDAWIISQKEYTEDTVFWSLKPADAFSARRRTTHLFLSSRLASAAKQRAYSWIDNTDNLWKEIRSVLFQHDPANIAINAHREISFSSGLHAGELDAIKAGLGNHWSRRFTVQPLVAVEFVAAQIDAKLPWYKRMQETAWAIISEGFSEKVVTPDVTTTADVEWWMREKIQSLNYTTWFQPTVTIVKPGSPWGVKEADEEDDDPDRPITYGDCLHVDFGVTAMGMNTDTQHLAYVLPPGETSHDAVPQGFKDGLRKGNRLQDITRTHMKAGKKGNDVLRDIRAQMDEEGIEGRVYSHPIGDWGHSAGGVIGMTNMQDNVPNIGELPLVENSWYSVELMADHFVPEINKTLSFPLEEDVYYTKDGTYEWVYGRQEKFHLIKTPAAGYMPQDEL